MFGHWRKKDKPRSFGGARELPEASRGQGPPSVVLGQGKGIRSGEWEVHGEVRARQWRAMKGRSSTNLEEGLLSHKHRASPLICCKHGHGFEEA